MLQSSVENLILQLAKGDRDSFEELYGKTKASVYGFALSILKKPQDAEDVMQDTYIKIYNGIERYRPQGKPMAWILRITRNLAYDKLRLKSETDISLEEDWVQEGKKEGKFDFTEASVDKILLEAVIKELPDLERQIIILYSVAGLKHREIAKILEIPLSTSLSKYYRSLSKLRKMLGEEEK